MLDLGRVAEAKSGLLGVGFKPSRPRCLGFTKELTLILLLGVYSGSGATEV